jgi:hypothetical protein
MPEERRKYDKGEKRFKHAGRGSKPEVQFVRDNPKRFVGKCPANISREQRQSLLEEAIAAPNGDREADYSKHLYVVHEGAIYEGRTSDAGVSYHAFPYRGKLSKEILSNLRKMAERKDCIKDFEDWVKQHIQT